MNKDTCDHNFVAVDGMEPTCQKEGMTDGERCSVCGSVSKPQASIPKVPHDYADGVCKYCNVPEKGCNHKDLKQTWIYFEDFGACKGYIIIEGCSCGQRSVLVDKGYSSCRFIEDKYETSKDADGEHILAESHCAKCGLRVCSSETVQKGEGCEKLVSSTLTITFNGQFIVDGATYEEKDARHNMQYESIKFEDIGACYGGYINAYTCLDCGLNDENLEFSFGNCMPQLTETENVTDDGRVVYVRQHTCINCGITQRVIETRTYKNENSCMYSYNVVKEFVFKGDVLARNEYTLEGVDHDFKYTYNMDGDTCDDGYSYVANCKKCGETYRGDGEGHRWEFSEERLDASVACGITIYKDECDICGNMELNVVFTDCQEEWDSRTYVDNKGYEHEVNIHSCRKCGIKYTTDRYQVPENDGNCTYTVYTHYVLENSTQTIYDVNSKYERQFHDIKTTYSNVGDCEKGYDVYETCRNCNYKNSFYAVGHRYTYDEINLSESHGACDGVYIYVEFCEVCDEALHVGFGWGMCVMTYEETTYTEGGIEYTKQVNRCRSCGLTVTCVKNYVLSDASYCLYDVHTVYTVEKVGMAVEQYEYISQDTRHDFVQQYDLHGTDCDDGYTVTERCTVCGESYEYESMGHKTKTKIIDAYTEGACKGSTVCIDICVICENAINGYYNSSKCEFEGTYSTYTDNEGNEHDVYTNTCIYCGFTELFDRYNVKVGTCDNEEHFTYKYTIDGKLIADYSRMNKFQNHDCEQTYTLLGADCNEEYIVKESCKECDYVNEYWSRGHMEHESQIIELEEHGACDGTYIENRVCVACGCIVSSNLNHGAAPLKKVSSTNEVDEEGNKHSVIIYECSERGLQYILETYDTIDDDGNYVMYKTVIYKLGDFEYNIKFVK